MKAQHASGSDFVQREEGGAPFCALRTHGGMKCSFIQTVQNAAAFILRVYCTIGGSESYVVRVSAAHFDGCCGVVQALWQRGSKKETHNNNNETTQQHNIIYSELQTAQHIDALALSK